ncbi:hypothetical protein [Methylococcus sp. EFPC2]|uniref:hypothetical protein n=1 Tax=Methylococcus sp. EFPC2 TaxID=2812648 RepID=UPI001967E91F|nr:hypothetical protein [Methylococcus sp. EFPC2]QSA98484.1 hypothetical protein JWZ97_06675 [Methylococcus sp. EFPC2]
MTQPDENQVLSPVHVSPDVPYMHRERFAQLVGVSVGVVDGWADRGQIPCVVVGKHKLVNVALLFKQALEQEVFL